MASSSSVCFLLVLLFTPLILSVQIPKHYVVYMGGVSDEADFQTEESAHLQLLSTIIPREEGNRVSLLHHYKHAFKGFSAMLTEQEASFLSEHDEIVSVFPDSVLELHTTRSWDFLDSISGSESSSPIHDRHGSSDVIIGIIDTGIWPESPSFSDRGLEEIPSKWRGICMESSGFTKSSCNRKLIGARYYNLPDPPSNGQNTSTSSKREGPSPRDTVGHGTHTASIAAGSPVANASYYGLARGTARGGGWPAASPRIAAYKACTEDGCSGSVILKAIDDAIADGVDIISISIGMSSVFQPEFLGDPIAIGAFHAEQKGIMVICSGGNEGPEPYTVVNTAPWIFTVAASSIDRGFRSSILLGNGRVFEGSGIHFSNTTRSENYPLVYGKDAAGEFVPLSEARSCSPGSLDPKKVARKIVVCVGNGRAVPRKIQKLVVEDAGGRGVILINEDQKTVPFDSGVYPFSEIGNEEGYKILKYIAQARKPRATILPAVDVPRFRPAPVVAYFSSRGPGVLTENILKPDVMAPGVAILGSVVPNLEKGSVPAGKKPSMFAVKSGTSMACPHVTGAAAFLKSLHPSWTPSMIKSALMTTATLHDNMKRSMTNTSGLSSDPHEMGVGEISPSGASNPGLVFETTQQDHLSFLCFFGYKDKIIRSMTKTLNFTCPEDSSQDSISTVNYPSISMGNLQPMKPAKMVHRTATNVGSSGNATYVSRIEAPEGLTVRVFPEKLVFKESVKKISFRVSFYGMKMAAAGYNYGSITWSDGTHLVRSVFAVNVQKLNVT